MQHSNYLEAVRRQYEELPYPPCDPERDKAAFPSVPTAALDIINHYGFEGRQDFKGFRALVAGSGTGDSTIALAEQLRGFDAEIVYLDMSAASMALAQRRAKIRGLTNITWVHDSLLELPNRKELGRFDFIDCIGVLHHLQSPEAGLAALCSVLKDDGVLSLMVYGTYGRQAVYQMQDILRTLNAGVTDTALKLDTAKKMLKAVETLPWALSLRNPESDNNRYGDAGIYDLLLHSQDRAYTVPEVYALLDGQGLTLQQFFASVSGLGKVRYSPFVKTDPALHPAIRKLAPREQQALAEKILGTLSMHSFYASRKPVAVPNPEDASLIPSLSIGYVANQPRTIAQAHADFAAKMAQAGERCVYPYQNIDLTVRVTPNLKALVKAMDGVRSIREICEEVQRVKRGRAEEVPALEALHCEFLAFYREVHMMDVVLLRRPGTPSCKSYFELQRPVMEKYA